VSPPDSHLDPQRLHMRLLALEREVPKQAAWCRQCKEETRELLTKISRENAAMLANVAEHTAKVDALLARASCSIRKPKP